MVVNSSYGTNQDDFVYNTRAFDMAINLLISKDKDSK